MNDDDILAQLVAFPSTTDNIPAKLAATEYVANYLQQRGMHIIWHDKGDTPCFVATTRRGVITPTVALAGHLDVVPAAKEMFKLRAENGRLHGRGAYDMKFAVASYMKVVDILQDNLSEYDFSIMIVTDEEEAGKRGISSTKQLLGAGYIPKMAIIPDGGRDWQLETFAKGFMHYKVEAHGKTAHGSRPWEGENALLKLISALGELKEHFKDHGPDTDTLNIGVIKSGEAVNKIPDYAQAEFEMRLSTLGSLAKRAQMVEDLCQKHDIQATLLAGWEPIVNDLSNTYVQTFAQCIEDIVGIKNTGFRSFGGSDARFFAAEGVPYASFYPFGGGHHSADEWIKDDSVEVVTELLLQYLRRVAHNTSIDEEVALSAEAVDTIGEL